MPGNQAGFVQLRGAQVDGVVLLWMELFCDSVVEECGGWREFLAGMPGKGSR